MKRYAALTLLALIALVNQAVASPIPIGDALSRSGDGITATWVAKSGDSPDTIAEALAALALGPSDPEFRAQIVETVPNIAFNDATAPTEIGDSFAVLLDGFLNVTQAGNYQFDATHDDGFQLTIGGHVVSQFDGNTGTRTTSASVFLQEGLYDIQYLGWEQGGAFRQELAWTTPGAVGSEIVPQSALFTQHHVPDAGAGSVAAIGILGLLGAAKRRRTA